MSENHHASELLVFVAMKSMKTTVVGEWGH